MPKWLWFLSHRRPELIVSEPEELWSCRSISAAAWSGLTDRWDGKSSKRGEDKVGWRWGGKSFTTMPQQQSRSLLTLQWGHQLNAAVYSQKCIQSHYSQHLPYYFIFFVMDHLRWERFVFLWWPKPHYCYSIQFRRTNEAKEEVLAGMQLSKISNLIAGWQQARFCIMYWVMLLWIN